MNRFGKALLNFFKALIIPAIVYVVFLIITGGRFGSLATMTSVVRTASVPLLIAMGMSLNMSMGMWDFSVGSVVYASAILGANLTAYFGWGIPGLFLFALLIGIAMSAFTGFLYNKFRVPSLVLSLGLAIAYEAIPNMIAPNATGMIGILDGFMAQMPYCLVVIGFMAILLHLIYTYTTFGKRIMAIGANIGIANSAGINLDKTKFLSFVLGGVFFGLAGAMYMSMNVSVIAVMNFASVSLIFVFMLGVFIAGLLVKFVPYTLSVVIGVFTIRMLGSALVACGLSSQMRSVSTGFFLLVVLSISANQTLFTERKMRKESASLADKEYHQGISI